MRTHRPEQSATAMRLTVGDGTQPALPPQAIPVADACHNYSPAQCQSGSQPKRGGGRSVHGRTVAHSVSGAPQHNLPDPFRQRKPYAFRSGSFSGQPIVPPHAAERAAGLEVSPPAPKRRAQAKALPGGRG